jgi:hypothetical protein
MSWLFPFPFAFLSKVMREVEAQYECGQNERHEEEEPIDLYVDAEGRLQGTAVHHDTSPKWSKAPLLASSGPVMVVSHGTATARLDAKGRPISDVLLAAIRKSGGREASWHVLVDHDGGIWQSIPFAVGAWHAGSESAARVVVDGRLCAPNGCSIGVEYVNAGECRFVDAAWSLKRQQYEAAQPAWRAWPFSGQKPSAGAPQGRTAGPVIPEAELVALGSRRWHAYTAAQFEARRRINEALLRRWPQLAAEVVLQHPEGRRVTLSALEVGHVDIDPRRKADPYPTFVTRRVS